MSIEGIAEHLAAVRVRIDAASLPASRSDSA